MDKVDLLILSYLKENARMKASDIGKAINFSVSSVIERIKKLEKSGIIEKYTVKLNEDKLGNSILALMEVSLADAKQYDNFMTFAKNHKRVLSCYYVAGDFDFMVKVRANSSENLEKIHREIKSFEGVKSIKTYFALKEVKCEMSEIPEEE
ncbi:MAG: Lrp/AsnC family transcriptional regulator [Clostridia bacterium]|nr:Lrp/AsnC family transcriptional regulator [Clostridia bacterium]